MEAAARSWQFHIDLGKQFVRVCEDADGPRRIRLALYDGIRQGKYIPDEDVFERLAGRPEEFSNKHCGGCDELVRPTMALTQQGIDDTNYALCACICHVPTGERGGESSGNTCDLYVARSHLTKDGRSHGP